MSTRIGVPGGEVSVVTSGDERGADALIVLAPGAGAGLDSDFMSFFADRLGSSGLFVARFNFLYLEAGRKTPDRQPVLEQTYEAILDHLGKKFSWSRLVIGGKSMGGRIASHVATRCKVDGLVFLGYPLHPPGRPDRMRDAHLYQIRAPMLFVEGTRDPFCPLETLASVRASIASSSLVVIEDGDHSLKVRKSSGRQTSAAWDEAAVAITKWVHALPEP